MSHSSSVPIPQFGRVRDLEDWTENFIHYSRNISDVVTNFITTALNKSRMTLLLINLANSFGVSGRFRFSIDFPNIAKTFFISEW